MLAPPITFEIDGEQYVSILTGSGGGDLFGGEPLPPIEIQASLTYNNFGRLLVFKLGGKETLPIPNVRDKTIPEQKLVQVSICLLYTSPSPRDGLLSRMPSSA